MLVVYLGCTGLALGLAIAGCAQAFADKYNEYNYARRQWTELSNNQILIFQQQNKCCNFDTLPPCCRFAPGQGDCINTEVCYDQITDHLESQFELIAVTNLLQAIYLFVVFLLSALLCKVIERSPNFSFRANDGKNANDIGEDYEFDKGDDDFFK